MEDKNDSVKLKLRIGNKIFTATVTSNAVADILMNKDKSSIVQLMSKGTPESVVIGNFKEKVEILSVSQLEQGNQINNNSGGQVMEIEVIEINCKKCKISSTSLKVYLVSIAV